MSLVAILTIIFGLKQTAQDGLRRLPVARHRPAAWSSARLRPPPVRLADPMIDLRLFRIPSFSAALAVNVLAIFVAVGYFLFVAQYLQLVLGLSPLQAGIWSVPSAIGFIVGSNLAPRIVRVVRPAFVMARGLAIAAAGLAVLTQVGLTERAGRRRRRVGRHLARAGAGVRPDDRAHRGLGTAGAGGRRVRDLRDRRRARWGARDLDPGQHRRRDLSRRGGPSVAGRGPRRCRGGRAGHPRSRCGVAAELPGALGDTM